jgi:hypothetical protein
MAIAQRCANIQYGDGVPVVVRARENLVHGEGEQLVKFNTRREGAEAL